MFTISRFRMALVAAATMVAPAAHAGGYIAPVEPAPIIAPVVEPVRPWTGAYVGGSLGYSFGADDEVGLEYFETGESLEKLNDLGQVDISGVTGGVHVGYRWQRNRWVFGPELGVEFGNVDDETDLVYTTPAGLDVPLGARAKSEMNNILSLRAKAGYLVDDRTMIFGTAGYVRGDFDYTLNEIGGYRQKESFHADGYSVGLGVERRMTDRLSLTAEWEYRNFGDNDVDFYDPEVDDAFLRTVATPEHHNVKIGLNFSF